MSATQLGPFRVLLDDDGNPFPGSQTDAAIAKAISEPTPTLETPR